MTAPLPVLPVYKTIRAALADATGHPAGLGKLVMTRDGAGKPTDRADLPQSVLYVQDDRVLEPTWDLTGHLQLTVLCRCVARTADQLEWLADKVRGAWLGRTSGAWTVPMPVQGMAWMSRDLTTGPVDPERLEVFSRPLTLLAMLTSA